MFVDRISWPSSITGQIPWSTSELWSLIYPSVQIKLVLKNHIYWIIIKLYDNVCGYHILPKFVNRQIASSIQIIQIDSRHLLSYYMPISLVYRRILWHMDTLVCDWNDYAKLLCIEHNIDFRNQEYLLTFVCPTFKCLVDNWINN